MRTTRTASDRSRINRGFVLTLVGITFLGVFNIYNSRTNFVQLSYRDYADAAHSIFDTIVDGNEDENKHEASGGTAALFSDDNSTTININSTEGGKGELMKNLTDTHTHNVGENQDMDKDPEGSVDLSTISSTNSSDVNKDVKVRVHNDSTRNPTDEDTYTYFSTEEYRKNRIKNFYSWYEGNETNTLVPDADINGTILDFAVAGFPKCGTTSIMANLGHYAPLPVQDVCTPAAQTVYYSYINWPKKYGNANKTLRGTKCPAVIDDGYIAQYSKYLPRTKMIVGIRHPVTWFQSFWNMQALNGLTLKLANHDPYQLTVPCNAPGKAGCRSSCPPRKLLCVNRARFHIPLASLGKTELTPTERQLLAPHDRDGGERLENLHIRNPIFLYDQGQLRQDYVWDEMANFLSIPGGIEHNRYHGSHGKGKNSKYTIDICDEKYDRLRAMIMPYSFDLSVWLQQYFIPVAKNESRTDVVIPNPDVFMEVVEQYKHDPCQRLVRMDNGTFALTNHTQ